MVSNVGHFLTRTHYFDWLLKRFQAQEVRLIIAYGKCGVAVQPDVLYTISSIVD